MNPVPGRPDLITRKLVDAGLVVSRYGGQVLSWTTGTRDRLYRSPSSTGVEGKPVRGGIPVCFPQFGGRGALPKHGFARTSMWTEATDHRSAASGQLRLQLRDDAHTLALWPHRFLLELLVDFSARHLSVTLEVSNTDLLAWDFSAALHTYYRVDSVQQVQLHGLRGLTYEDALDGGRRAEAVESSPDLAGAIDRVYLAAPQRLTLSDPHQQLQIFQRGFADTVVWNPGRGGASALGDLPAGDEQHMLCVEAAQVATPIRLGPGETWRGSQETHLR